MRIKDEELIPKYFQALKDLKNVLHYTDKISMDSFIKDNGLSKDFIRILKDGGIIKTNGKRATGCRWYWVCKVNPNIEMTKELVSRLNNYKRIENKKPSIKKSAKASTYKVLDYSEFPVFFGLFKIKVNHYYKIVIQKK